VQGTDNKKPNYRKRIVARCCIQFWRSLKVIRRFTVHIPDVHRIVRTFSETLDPEVTREYFIAFLGAVSLTTQSTQRTQRKTLRCVRCV